ncbi:MAG: 6-phosphogluconolactonase [Verrucomicrobia bacterium]|nr:6-phosphogluconolactonase [Verrucomicrobiota bacterium]
MGNVSFQHFSDDEELASAVADEWSAEIRAAQAAGRPHVVALSGGRISLRVFAAMADRAKNAALDLTPARFFWADERCVPPGHPDSNYLPARNFLFGPAGVPAGHIHRIRGEDDPALAAAAATAALREVTGTGPGCMPSADLVLLGMGEDGHVASLFPGHDSVLTDETSVFLPVENSPKPPARRVTLGIGPILAAREVWVVVAGDGKSAALRESLSPNGSTPLATVIRRRADTRIMSTVPHPS